MATQVEARFRCQSCRCELDVDEPRWRCECGGLLDLVYDLAPGFLEVGRRCGAMAFRGAIPLPDGAAPLYLGEGQTPLVPCELLGRSVHLKLEMLSPTGSFKDRGASVVMARAKALHIDSCVEDSSGNAGAAIAAYAAAAGIACEVFVPAHTSPAKLRQIESYGAKITRIDGPRENAARAVEEAAQMRFYASHVRDPFFLQGVKTISYEIFLDLGGKSPDFVVVPVGNGTLLIGAYLGFQDLVQSGRAQAMPRFVAVQSARCAPLFDAVRGHARSVAPVLPTAAEGIAISKPPRLAEMRGIIEKSHGSVLTVEESDILTAQAAAGRQGLFIEPTAAAAVAALPRLDLPSGATVVLPLTGHGLKAVV